MSRCGDCAFRDGSPERSNEKGYDHNSNDLIDEMVAQPGVTFFCHQGMRRVVLLRHPSGVEIPAHPASYRPAIEGRLSFKADGAPADICAGFTQARKANSDAQ